MTYDVAGTNYKGEVVKVLAKNVDGYYAAKSTIYHALRSTDFSQFAMIDSATGQVVARFQHGYSYSRKLWETKRTSNRREGRPTAQCGGCDARIPVGTAYGLCPVHMRMHFEYMALMYAPMLALPAEASKTDGEIKVALLDRIMDLTYTLHKAEDHMADLANEYRGMAQGRIPADANAKLDLFDRMGDAARDAYNALSEIEMARVALAELEGGVDDGSASLQWCVVCGQQVDPGSTQAMMAAVDPNNHPEPICRACDPLAPFVPPTYDPNDDNWGLRETSDSACADVEWVWMGAKPIEYGNVAPTVSGDTVSDGGSREHDYGYDLAGDGMSWGEAFVGTPMTSDETRMMGWE